MLETERRIVTQKLWEIWDYVTTESYFYCVTYLTCVTYSSDRSGGSFSQVWLSAGRF